MTGPSLLILGAVVAVFIWIGGGARMAPEKGGLGTFSPRLDAAGNSVRGQLAARFLSRALGLDPFVSEPARAPSVRE